MYRDYDEEERYGMQSEGQEEESLTEDFVPLAEDGPVDEGEVPDGDEVSEDYEPLPETESAGIPAWDEPESDSGLEDEPEDVFEALDSDGGSVMQQGPEENDIGENAVNGAQYESAAEETAPEETAEPEAEAAGEEVPEPEAAQQETAEPEAEAEAKDLAAEDAEAAAEGEVTEAEDSAETAKPEAKAAAEEAAGSEAEADVPAEETEAAWFAGAAAEIDPADDTAAETPAPAEAEEDSSAAGAEIEITDAETAEAAAETNEAAVPAETETAETAAAESNEASAPAAKSGIAGAAAAAGACIAAAAGKCRDVFLSWKRWQQVLAIILVILLLLVGIAYAYFHSKYILMDISDGVYSSEEELKEDESLEEQQETLIEQLESGELEEAEVIESTGEVYETEEIFNILLIGTDDRTEGFSDNARGDTCILLSINRSTGKINLISFERATGVKIPSGDYEGQWDWLTHTFWYGGPDMMMTVIRDNFKVDVTKYVRINIRTFMKLVDAVGGVDIDMTEAEVDNINHPEGTFTADHIKSLGVEDEVQQDLVVGVNHLNGATAMLYARLRSIDSDWYRVVRQRNVILAAVENLKSLSLTEVDNLLNEVLPLVQTNLTEADVASLLTDVGLFLEMDYGSITFPLQNTYGLMDGMAGRKVLAVDFETNAQELQNLISGEVEADELAEKYENLEDELEDYSYKDSEVYQENYADAESIAGRSYSYSSSGTAAAAAAAEETQDGEETADTAAGADTLAGTGGLSADTAAGVDDLTEELLMDAAAADGENTEDAGAETAAEETASAAESTSLGVVESVSTDAATGLVTVIYYNEATGVRTAVVTNPADGSTAVATEADTAAALAAAAAAEAEAAVETEVTTAEDETATTVTEDTADTLTGNAAAEAYAAALAAASGE